MEKINKRIITFRNSGSSLTSPRVKIILRSPKDSAKLAQAVRMLRKQNSVHFEVSKETMNEIEQKRSQLAKA